MYLSADLFFYMIIRLKGQQTIFTRRQVVFIGSKEDGSEIGGFKSIGLHL